MNDKILIIDDEPDVVTYLVAVLKANGFRPHSTTDPDRGMEMIHEYRPDLICLDIMMPEKSGISVYTRIRRDKYLCQIPVIIISGVSRESEFDFRTYVPDTSIAPPDCYLEKPIVIDQFLEIVRRLTASPATPRKGRVADA